MVRRLSIVLALLVVASVSIYGRRITEEQATTYARNWWLQKDGPRLAVLEPVETEFTNIYLFVDTAGHGFVMLAADDRSLPVLGYSLSNDFSVDDMPAAVHDWVQSYNDQIKYLIDNNIEKTAEINAQWQDLSNQRSQLPRAWSTQVGPLVQSKWGQQAPFNNMCPSGTYTGCVATAMSQIMHYHQFPQSGVGNNSYASGYGTLTAYFANVTFDWANMLNEYKYDYEPDIPVPLYNQTQADAVATLMKYVGIAVNMKYGTAASSANTVAANFNEPAAVNAYKKYFKYKWTATSVHIDDYTHENWRLLLKNELDNNRPMQYSGSSEGSGHSWVCDGYDRDEFFHFNWGSPYGTDNGFFIIGLMNKNASVSYNLCNKAVIGIEPDRTSGNSVTISVSSNNTSWGTVSGGGTYNKYIDTVTITPVANDGYRFVGWSDANDATNKILSKEVPLMFQANGDNATLKANFESIVEDTLYYCSGGYTHYYGPANDDFYAAIKIPSNCLISGNQLTHVMFYSPDYALNLQVLIYSANTLTGQTNPVISFNYTTTKVDAWETIPLPSPWTIVTSQDLYVAVKSPYYVAASMPAATANGSYCSWDLDYGWQTQTENGTYVTWMIKAITSSPNAPHKIQVNKDAVTLTTVSHNVDLRANGVAVSNKGASVTFAVDSDPNGCVTIIDGYKLKAHKVGTVRLKASAKDNQNNPAEEYVDLRIERGTLLFDKASYYLWDNPLGWGPNYDVIPDSVNYDVMIDIPCYLNGASYCHDMQITLNGILTIYPNEVMYVAGRLKNDFADGLIIKANSTNSGTIIYASGSPKATVETYLKGTTGSNNRNPQWQLRGSIVDDFALKDASDWSNIRVYRWDEDSNSRGCWTNKMIGSSIALQPWKGYGFANYSANPVTVKYTGTLLNADTTWTLTKTGSGNANVGNNMLTNSYSAPIPINKLSFDNAKASVIFYNTGSWVDWNTFHGDTAKSGYSAGQMLVCPIKTAAAAGLPDKIPSGQSFYVVANSHNATVEAKYSDVVASASGPMFAPASDDNFNVLGVTVSGSKGNDRAVLIECEECTNDYDDGYDGMKYFGSSVLPQLFVVNTFGNTSINADQNIIGQKMGVYTSTSGDTLTMKFETAKLSGYSSLKVKDLINGLYTDVLAGEEYQFITTGNDVARFEIVGVALGDDHETVGQVSVVGNTIHAGDYEGVIVMYDMSGRLVWQTVVERNTSVELPELLHGVYVVKSDCSTIKIVK